MRDVTSATCTDPSSRRVLADPGEVVLAERGSGDDPEPLFGEPRHRESHSIPPRALSICV